MGTRRLKGIEAIRQHLSQSIDSESVYSHHNVNPFVFRRILHCLSNPPFTSFRGKPNIIEFGARAGALGKKLCEVYPQAVYTGIEPFPPYSQECFNIYTSTCEELCDERLGRNIINKADIFVYSDVLEHLVDPWKHLYQVAKLAKKNSTIIASIPNVLHHSCLSSLGNGKFEYEEWGVMDMTHLRFFTLSTMLDLFSSTGWDPSVHEVETACDPDGLRLVEGYKPGEQKIVEFGNIAYKIRNAEEAANLAAYQYILSATKTT